MSSSYAYTLDEGGRSVSSPQTMPTMDDEDDDICPVCESECTCAKRSRGSVQVTSPPTAPSYMTGFAPPPPAVRKSSEGDASPPSSTHSSLKIKLTLRPPFHSAQASAANAHPKKKKNTEGELSADSLASIEPSSSTYGQALSVVNGALPSAGGSVRKKRGRPTKAFIAARDAAKGSNSAEARLLDADTDRSIDGGAISHQTKQVTSRKSALPKSITTKKGKKLHGAAAASKARADLRRAQQQGNKYGQKKKRQSVADYVSSELSDVDDDEGDDNDLLGLPTFISAFSSSSNSSSSESDSGSDTDSAERFPHNLSLNSQQHLGHDHAQRRRAPNHESRPRQSGTGEDDTDAGMDADTDAEEEKDEEDEVDVEADAIEGVDVPGERLHYAGIATGWTDDDEDSFDAELFFANLSDSTADDTEDENIVAKESPKETVRRDGQLNAGVNGFASSDLDVMRLSEFAAAGFLAPFAELERNHSDSIGFEHAWDHPLASNGLRDMLGLGTSNAHHDAPLGSAFDFALPGMEDADAMMATSEEEEAVAIFDNDCVDVPEEEIFEVFDDSDGGETTEDEYVNMDGIATPRNLILLHFPASLGAIDPMSTVNSSIRGSADRGRRMSLGTPARERAKKVLKPHEILSGKGRASSEEKERPSLTLSISPAMGAFAPQATDKSKVVVLSGSGSTTSGEAVPSPYPAIRRLRKKIESSSLSGPSSSNSRQSSLFSATRSPFEQMLSSIESTDETEAAEPIKLDDVLDTAFLDSQASDDALPETTQTETGESDSEHGRHLQNLQRWDHVPINAFRRALETTTSTDISLMEMDKLQVVPPTPIAPRPADGFSYGSSAGGMLRGSPMHASLWNSNSSPTTVRTTARRGPDKLKPSDRLAAIMSPLLLPIRDGDRTPSDERRYQQHQHYQQHSYLGHSGQHAAQAHAQNIKSRKELRKEKKRSRKFLGASAATTRHHFPNAKNRSMSGMQRSSSSSIPSLSI